MESAVMFELFVSLRLCEVGLTQGSVDTEIKVSSSENPELLKILSGLG